MSNIYVWSDPHFHHKKIMELCRSQFSSIEEHDEVLVNNHNSVVKQDDVSICLGDVVLGSTDYSILERLNGRKWLILGNHDSAERVKQFSKYFEKILAYHTFNQFDTVRAGVILSHIPVHSSQLEERFKFNIHGHLHDKSIDDPRYFCASMEQINYTPMEIGQIMNVLKSR